MEEREETGRVTNSRERRTEVDPSERGFYKNLNKSGITTKENNRN